MQVHEALCGVYERKHLELRGQQESAALGHHDTQQHMVNLQHQDQHQQSQQQQSVHGTQQQYPYTQQQNMEASYYWANYGFNYATSMSQMPATAAGGLLPAQSLGYGGAAYGWGML
jgi:hypothetical protein